MLFKEFQKDYWEDVMSSIRLPCTVNDKSHNDFHKILMHILPQGSYSLLEVGCAPGKWLAYFNQYYGYKVSGIDYAPHAVELTKKNLKLLNVEADIICGDFLKYAPNAKCYDVIFSAGFIEHFVDTKSVVQKIREQVKPEGGYVVTIIPNCYGINGWISKTFRPQVYNGHIPIDLKALISVHELQGIKTIFANYCGGIQIVPPIDKNYFAKKFHRISLFLNMPFVVLNKMTSLIFRKMGIYPRFRCISSSLIYIGWIKNPSLPW